VSLTMAYLSILLCLVLGLTCTAALRTNRGTGKGCTKASDGTGGPKCEGSQVGLCCDPTFTSDNCLTLMGDGNFLGAGSTGKVPQCADFSGLAGAKLQPYCCNEMDLPDCLSYSDYRHCPGDSNAYCCGQAAKVGDNTGGTNCLNAYSIAGCPQDRSHSVCC